MAESKYEITKHIGVLPESAKGWTKKLNLVSWNDRGPKYDIREWSPEREKMGKGVTLTEEEIENLTPIERDYQYRSVNQKLRWMYPKNYIDDFDLVNGDYTHSNQ